MWAGKPDNVADAQQAFLSRARANSLASRGKWVLLPSCSSRLPSTNYLVTLVPCSFCASNHRDVQLPALEFVRIWSIIWSIRFVHTLGSTTCATTGWVSLTDQAEYAMRRLTEDAGTEPSLTRVSLHEANYKY